AHRPGAGRSPARVHSAAGLLGPPPMTPLTIRLVEKSFVLHVQGAARLPVLGGVSLAVEAGECIVLAAPSGSGKSTLLRSVYGNYKPQAGEILVRHGTETVDMVSAPPRRGPRARPRPQ